MAKAGFVGVGVMGGRMAELLLDKGHTVTIYNRIAWRKRSRFSTRACSGLIPLGR